MAQYNSYVKGIETPQDIVGLLMALFTAFKPDDPPLISGSTKESVCPLELFFFFMFSFFLSFFLVLS